jgi:dihydropteroate synthase
LPAAVSDTAPIARRDDGSRLRLRAVAAPGPIAEPTDLYARPLGLTGGVAARALLASGTGWARGQGAFAAIEVLVRRRDHVEVVALARPALETWSTGWPRSVSRRFDALLTAIARPDAEPCQIMGVVNVTPDSFSDGGDFGTVEAALAHGVRLAEAGADMIDVGGESTRPGAQPIDPADEIARAVPVVRALAQRGLAVSIDTRNAATMTAALEAGAAMINDVSALEHDPASMAVAARASVPVVLMHTQGDPRTMQANPRYDAAPLEVFDALSRRVEACVAAGVARSRLLVDPGIGFGKTVGHNLELIARVGVLHGLGCGVLLGASRKSFIARLSRGEPPKERLPGSLAVALRGVEEGCAWIRVHDVAETVQAVRVRDSVTHAC